MHENDILVGIKTLFSCSRFQRVDGAWGTFDKISNESSGMIRSLVLHDMDMAWATLRMTTERLAAIDYLLPYHKSHFALVIIIYPFINLSSYISLKMPTGYKEAW